MQAALFFALQLCAWAFLLPNGPQVQANETDHCDEYMTFCWYGDEVDAWGTVWTTDSPGEKSLEQVTEVRCVQKMHVCIVARNQKVNLLGRTVTNIDLYNVRSWDDTQVRAIMDESATLGCEQNTLVLNRVERGTMLISSPGPRGNEKRCTNYMGPPKTVIYRLIDPEMEKSRSILKEKRK